MCFSKQLLDQVRGGLTHSVLPGQQIDAWNDSFDSLGDGSSLPGKDIQMRASFGRASISGNRKAGKGSMKNMSEREV